MYAPLLVALVFILMFLFARGIARLGGATRRVSAPWLCGYAVDNERYRYRAGHLFDELNHCLGRKRPTAPVPPADRSVPAQPSTRIPPWLLEKS